MNLFPVGTSLETHLLVTNEVAVSFLGLEEARVLGTPWMILHMEITARNAVKPFLLDGQDTVGTQVNIKHLAATPLGMQARFYAEVLSVEGQRVLFKVEAFDEKEKIGEGTHERFIVDVARFATKLQAKKKECTDEWRAQ
ncbi:MAG: thioesterase family protein [Bryobacteraceae bacterium]